MKVLEHGENGAAKESAISGSRHEPADKIHGRLESAEIGYRDDGQQQSGRYLCQAMERYKNGDFLEATRFLKLANQSRPDDPNILCNLGNAVQECGAINEAIFYFLEALKSKPIFPEAYFNLGNALCKKHLFDDAIAAFDHSIRQNTTYTDAYVHRGLALEALGRREKALQSYEEALRIAPKHVNALVNRGNTLASFGFHAEAQKSYQAAIEAGPCCAIAHYNYGKLLYEMGQYVEALEFFDRAIAIRPDYANALASKAVVLLQLGRFQEGWELYEWRWRAASGRRGGMGRAVPLWRGDADLRGRTILLHAEQGLGDTIQFCRYVPMVKAMGARVVLEIQKPLLGLMKTLDGADDIIVSGATTPEHDYHCPLLSLPLAFKTTAESIPAKIPYLHAEHDRVKRWRSHLGERGLKIAINWQGNRKNPLDKGRSFPLSMLGEISRIDGVRLISLQKIGGLEQVGLSPTSARVEELPSDFDQQGSEFLDSAAVVRCVDLVISSDTSIAHLAGSLGAETLLPLKFVPDWRWMTPDVTISHWYPSLKLYRQTSPGDWAVPFRRITSYIYDRIGAGPRYRSKINVIPSRK
jgi:tetratricopeptide (TPR) repeat protein